MNPNQQFSQPNPFPQQPQPTTGPVLKIIFTVLVLMLWLIALAAEAYSNGTRGVTCFIFGWSMAFDNFFAFLAWLANIPFFIAYFMYAFSSKKNIQTIALVFASFAFLASFGAFAVTELRDELFSSRTPVDVSYGAFIWMGSLFLLVTGIIIKLVLPEPVKQNFPVQPMQNYPPQMYPPFPQQGYYQNYPQQNYNPNYSYPPAQNIPTGNPYPPQQNIPPQHPFEPKPNNPAENPYQPRQNNSPENPFQPPQNNPVDPYKQEENL